jgi:SAM-dependent methyltransferase
MSFDRMVKLYEETRVFDRVSFNSALDFLVGKCPPNLFPKLFEPGIGTGRIAIPLAERGYQVTGIDISQEMLAYLGSGLGSHKDNLPVYYQCADATQLPFPDRSFDIVIAVHLFYFIKEWKLAINEILRVLKTRGKLVLMHTGTGTEVPALNQRYKELCTIRGFQIKDIGVKSTQEVIGYLTETGHETEIAKNRWTWNQNINLKKAIEYIGLRAYSFTQNTPEKVHLSVIETLTQELELQYGGLDTEIKIPNQIYFVFSSCQSELTCDPRK